MTLLALFASLSCATPSLQPLSAEAMAAGPFAFVRDGETTREDVLLRLGDPSGLFEGERILTYVVRIDEDDELHVLTRRLGTQYGTTWQPGLYSLVLVFARDGLLERHSVVLGE